MVPWDAGGGGGAPACDCSFVNTFCHLFVCAIPQFWGIRLIKSWLLFGHPFLGGNDVSQSIAPMAILSIFVMITNNEMRTKCGVCA